MRIVVLTKRQYTNKDVIDDRYGRLWEIPLELVRNGNSVTCVCLSYQSRGNSPEIYEDPQGRAIRWINVNLGALAVFGILKYLYVVNKTIREENPDVIWSCSDTIYIVLGYYFSKFYKCQSFADLYDNFESFVSYRIPILRGLFRRVVRKSDGVTCVGDSLARHIRVNYGRTKNTSVITNAVDTSVFRPMDKADCRRKLELPQDMVLVGSAGDLSSHRGADMMFQAISEHPDDLENVNIAIAGYRTSDTQIPDLDRVHDLGLLSAEEVPILLNSLDVGVVYNRKSDFGDFCFPQKFYEVLACQIPIVAADVGELNLLLKDQAHLLYEDEDVNSFVTVIKQQLAERELVDLSVPTWSDQAALLRVQMQSAVDYAGMGDTPNNAA